MDADVAAVLREDGLRAQDAEPDRSQNKFAGADAKASQRYLTSVPSAPRRHWTINGDFLTLKATGVARYGREVTVALDTLMQDRHPLTQDLELRIVAPRDAPDALSLRQIQLIPVPEFRPRLPQFWVQLQLPRHVSGGLLSFCNLAPIRVDRHIVCIHDLQTRTVPESYGRLFRLVHRLILPRLGRRADRVTTVSEKSKDDLVRYRIAPADHLVVTYNGSDHVRKWQPDRACHHWQFDRPFVLCIGRNDAHKNTKLLWRLAEPLDMIGVDIALVGDIDLSRFNAKGHAKPDNILWLGRVDDDDLSAAFAKALCFVFPSRSEGFGLPAVEAMACGCPVIASLAPCLPEICGDAALFVDPDDVDGWVAAVQSLLNRPDKREALIAAGRAQAERYTWRDVAESYLRLMMAVDLSRANELV